MNDRMPPQADGLYDPRYEHDACGVAMVARLDNVPGHDVVVKALEALDNLEHRGAEGADIRTGDGAGLLMQLPHRFFRASVDFELPEPGRYGVCVCFLPARRAAPPPDRGAARAQRPRRGPARPRLARRARSTRTTSATPPTPRARTSASSSSRRAPASSTTRTPSSASSTSSAASSSSPSARSSTRRRARAGPRLQGHAQGAPAAQLLPRPAGRALRQRAGARAQPLLDEHLPELGARPSLSRDLPQRRDQHADGQRQLDARARVAARLASCSASTCRRSCRSCAPAARTPRPSTTSSSCSCSPGGRCRTR